MRTWTLAAAMATLTLLVASRAEAVPDILNYSGYLTNGAGDPIDCADPDACLGMAFRLYVQPEGGEQVWEEVFENVPVQGGVFHVLLGDSEPLYVEGLGAGDVWLGVRIGANAEMTPRQRIASSLFAVFASEAETCGVAETCGTAETCGDAQTLGGVSAESFARVFDLSAVATTGSYADLVDAPDLSGLALQGDLAAHEAASDAHHARYTDEEAAAAVGPHFTGDYADLAGAPDLGAYALAADLAGFASAADLGEHAGDAAAHHARYTDEEATAAVGPHFSGSYADLVGTPDLAAFVTDGIFQQLVETFGLHEAAFVGHAEDEEIHHVRYTDDEAVAAVGPHFSGSYADLANPPDLTVYATSAELTSYSTDADLATHAGDSAAHHARYDDSEAVAAVGPHFSGAYVDLTGVPDLNGFVTYPNLASHTDDVAAHHARYTDGEAVAAVGPHFSGAYSDLAGTPDLAGFLVAADLGPYATDTDLTSHAGDAAAHHARYADSEAVAAVGPHFSGDYADLAGAPDLSGFLVGEDLTPYATDTDLATHAGVAAAHHARYTDAEARAAVGPVFSGDFDDLANAPLPRSAQAIALKRWYTAREVPDDTRYACGSPVAMESDGTYVYTLCNDDGAGVYAHEAATGRTAWIQYLSCSSPRDLTLDGVNLWLTCTGNVSTVIGLRTETGAEWHTFTYSGFGTLAGITFDGTNLWVSSVERRELLAIDPVRGNVVRQVPLGGTPGPVAFDGKYVWTAYQEGAFALCDAVEGALVFEGGGFAGTPVYLVWTGRLMWLTHDDPNVSGGYASAIDPGAGGPVLEVRLGTSWSPGQAAFDGRNLWVTDRNFGRLRVVDAWTGGTVRNAGGGAGSYVALAFDGARVWVSDWTAGTLVQY